MNDKPAALASKKVRRFEAVAGNDGTCSLWDVEAKNYPADVPDNAEVVLSTDYDVAVAECARLRALIAECLERSADGNFNDRIRRALSGERAPDETKDDWCYEHGYQQHRRGSPACERADAWKQDYPALLTFHEKHALPSLMRPSCLVCGRVPEQWPPAIRHAELANIVVCFPCRDAATGSSEKA